MRGTFQATSGKITIDPGKGGTADLDDYNLEEVTLYAQCRKTRQRKKRR